MKKIIFIFIFLSTFFYNAQAQTLNLSGRIQENTRIEVLVDFKAKNLSNKLCVTSKKAKDHAYFFKVSAITLSSFRGDYNLDFDLTHRLAEKIKETIEDRSLLLPQGESLMSFISICDFAISQLSFQTDLTQVYVRNSINYSYTHALDVDRGTVRVFDYSFELLEGDLQLVINTHPVAK